MDNQATGDAGEDTPAFSQSAREKLEEESFQRYIDSRKAQNSWYKLLEKSSSDMCEIQLTAWIRMVTGILFLEWLAYYPLREVSSRFLMSHKKNFKFMPFKDSMKNLLSDNFGWVWLSHHQIIMLCLGRDCRCSRTNRNPTRGQKLQSS